MKILVVSDIHANIEALSAVLGAEEGNYSGFLFLGDVTGYGPDPEACIERLRGLRDSANPCFFLGGNHDAALVGKVPLEWFNNLARKSVEKTEKLLAPESLEWLSSLPASLEIFPGVWAAHASPMKPLTEYIRGGDETGIALHYLAANQITICFHGHTHEAAVFSMNRAHPIVFPATNEEVSFEGYPLLVNPGSVGFPRAFNGGRRPGFKLPGGKISAASYPAYYCMWDTVTTEIVFREARYDRRPVEKKIRGL